jgi:hypothetical protein
MPDGYPDALVLYFETSIIFLGRPFLYNSSQNFVDSASGRWPCAAIALEFLGEKTEEDFERKDRFLKDFSGFLDGLQEEFRRLPEEDRAKCGMQGIAAAITVKVDMAKKEVVLNKLYKYCHINYHLFTGLLGIIQQNFQEYLLIVPSLRGYQLAKEISIFLGMPEIECIYLKGDCDERLLMGASLAGLTVESVLEDTEKHYRERGGLQKKVEELGSGLEVSMYHQGNEGVEEVLWMQVKVALSNRN